MDLLKFSILLHPLKTLKYRSIIRVNLDLVNLEFILEVICQYI